MENLDSIIFYSIDRAIRTYRQYAQQQLKRHGFTITIDQWIIIRCLIENPEISQHEIAGKVFKDNASVTRIISLLVKAKYLTRKISKSDRRKTVLKVTELGLQTMEAVKQIVLVNREVALNGTTLEELDVTRNVMERITKNCEK